MCLFSHKKEKKQHKRKPPKNYILRLFFSRPSVLQGRNINSVLAGYPPAFALSARNINSDTREGQSGNVSEQAEGSMAALTAELAVP